MDVERPVPEDVALHSAKVQIPSSCIYIGNIDIARNIAGIVTPYLLTLANRNYPISVTPPMVVKVLK